MASVRANGVDQQMSVWGANERESAARTQRKAVTDLSIAEPL